MLLTATERLTMNTRPKNPANARNLNFCGIGSSGSGKTRFWLTPQLLQAHSSYVVVDPKLKEVLIHGIGAAAEYLSQLLRAEKLFLLDKPGACGEVLLGDMLPIE